MPEGVALAEEKAGETRVVKVGAPSNRKTCHNLRFICPPTYIVFYDGSKHCKCTVDLTVHEIALTVDSVFEEVNSGTP